jgi:hypothetical protein
MMSLYICKSEYSVYRQYLQQVQSHCQSRTSNNAVDISPDVETPSRPLRRRRINRRRSSNAPPSKASVAEVRNDSPSPVHAAVMVETLDRRLEKMIAAPRRCRRPRMVVETGTASSSSKLSFHDVTSTWFAHNAYTAQSLDYTRSLPGTGVTFSGIPYSPTPVLRLRVMTVKNRPRWVHCLQVYRL